MRLTRTVIGSFPRLDEDDLRAIDKAVQLQLRNGIELLSDGEQRGDMIRYLATAIPGLSVENGVPVIAGRIEPPVEPRSVKKISDYFILREKYPDTDFKVTLTGPTTLGMTCASRKIEGHYSSLMDFSIYEDLGEALRVIATPLIDARAFIQIDEPFLSQGFADLDRRARLIDRILEGFDSNRCTIHVCGYLGRQPLLEELAKLKNVSTLSFAFSVGREKDNLELLRREIFEGHSKKLGAGVVSVSPTEREEVDSPEMIFGRLSEISGRIGAENIGYVHPDCGLRATRSDLVELILQNLDSGASMFEESHQ